MRNPLDFFTGLFGKKRRDYDEADKKLIYVPIIHSYEEDPINRANIEFYARLMLDDDKVGRTIESIKEEMNDVVDGYWDVVEQKISEEIDDYKGVLVFNDGYYMKDDEIEDVLYASIEKLNSRNDKFLQKLLDNGAHLKNTEDFDLFKGYLMAAAGKMSSSVSEKEALERRDRHIAGRINSELKEGETAILFLGCDHDPVPYIEKDIGVKKIVPFDGKKKLQNVIDSYFKE